MAGMRMSWGKIFLDARLANGYMFLLIYLLF